MKKIITLSAILALHNGFSQNQVLSNFVYLNNSSNLGNQSFSNNNNLNSAPRNQAVLLASNQTIQRSSNTNKANNTSSSQATQQSNKNARKTNHQNKINNPQSQSNAINTSNINTIQLNNNITNSDNQNMQVLIFENNVSDQEKLPANPIIESETIETTTSQNFSFSLDLSLPKSIRSNVVSSSHARSNHLDHKWEKFKRQLLGKLTSHKKSKYHVDICFLWSN
jgi:hypothetical protein